MQFNFEYNWQNLICLVPIYDQNGGNSTEIWLKGGEKVLVQKKTKTVLRNLARVFALDLSQLKRKYGNLVGRKSSTPLPLHPNLILIPVKVRKPLAKDEGARGYIVKDQVSFCKSLESSLIEIKFWDSNNYLKCMQSETSFNLSLAHAEIIARECYHQLHCLQEKEDLYHVISALLTSLERKKIRS